MIQSPDNTLAARTLVNLCGELIGQGRADDAYAAAAGAVSLDGTMAAGHNAMAAALNGIIGRERQMRTAAQAALMLDGDEPSAWHNLSMAEARLYLWDEAMESAERAVSLAGETHSPYYPSQAAFVAGLRASRCPFDAELNALVLRYCNLAENQAAKLEVSAGRIFYAECAVARAIAYARMGNWDAHFKQLRSRHALSPSDRNPLALAEKLGLLWRLGMPTKKRAVIYLEWGFGDQIQFSRMVERARFPGVEHVSVCCSRPLVDLMRTLKGVDAVFAHEDMDLTSSRPFGAYRGQDFGPDGEAMLIPVIDLMEYAAAAGLFPLGAWGGPYLDAAACGRGIKLRNGEPWIERVPGKIAVTFCWQGDPRQQTDFARRIPFAEFGRWAAANHERYSFHSLQTRFGGYCEPWEGWPADVPLQDVGSDIQDMADAAAAIAASDVFVGQCGGSLHLAGALGHPAVGLLCKAHDWRWDLGEPLYGFPLVTQRELGDWPSAFDQLNGVISEKLALEPLRRVPA